MIAHLTVSTSALMALLVAAPLSLTAQQDSLSLRGLATVSVAVAVSTDLLAPPLDSASLTTALELRLRRVGLRVVAPSPTVPVIVISLSAAGTRGDVATATSLQLFVMQLASLSRRPATRGLFTTWMTERLTISDAAQAHDLAERMLARVLDEFENAWRAANAGP